MSFTLTIECPTHPAYTAKIAPSADCAMCRLMFAVRNNAHKFMSTPREERDDPNERLIAGLT